MSGVSNLSAAQRMELVVDTTVAQADVARLKSAVGSMTTSMSKLAKNYDEGKSSIRATAKDLGEEIEELSRKLANVATKSKLYKDGKKSLDTMTASARLLTAEIKRQDKALSAHYSLQKKIATLNQAAAGKKALYGSSMADMATNGGTIDTGKAKKRLLEWEEAQKSIYNRMYANRLITEKTYNDKVKVLREQTARESLQIDAKAKKEQLRRGEAEYQQHLANARRRMAVDGKVGEQEKRIITDINRRAQALEKLSDEERRIIKLIQARQREDKKLTKEEEKLLHTLDRYKSVSNQQSEAFLRISKSVGKAWHALSKYRNMLLLASFAVRPMLRVMQQSVSSYVEYEKAMKGTVTIGEKFGYTANQTKAAVSSLTEDGLFKLTDASKALRNLLSTGIGLPQAIKTLDALRDAAAFNRQGTLAYGEAIVGATDGIKNMISRMVDNAGVTKNLSNILKEQAAIHGLNTAAMSEKQKMMLITQGIVKEAAKFEGDAARMAMTAAGSIDQMSVAVKALSVEFGRLLSNNFGFGVMVGLIEDGAKGLSHLLRVASGNSSSIDAERGARIGLSDVAAERINSRARINARDNLGGDLRMSRLFGWGSTGIRENMAGGMAYSDAKDFGDRWEESEKRATTGFKHVGDDKAGTNQVARALAAERAQIISEIKAALRARANDEATPSATGIAYRRMEWLDKRTANMGAKINEVIELSNSGMEPGSIDMSLLSGQSGAMESMRNKYTNNSAAVKQEQFDATVSAIASKFSDAGVNVYGSSGTDQDWNQAAQDKINEFHLSVRAGQEQLDADKLGRELALKLQEARSVMLAELEKNMDAASLGGNGSVLELLAIGDFRKVGILSTGAIDGLKASSAATIDAYYDLMVKDWDNKYGSREDAFAFTPGESFREYGSAQAALEREITSGATTSEAAIIKRHMESALSYSGSGTAMAGPFKRPAAGAARSQTAMQDELKESRKAAKALAEKRREELRLQYGSTTQGPLNYFNADPQAQAEHKAGLDRIGEERNRKNVATDRATGSRANRQSAQVLGQLSSATLTEGKVWAGSGVQGRAASLATARQNDAISRGVLSQTDVDMAAAKATEWVASRVAVAAAKHTTGTPAYKEAVTAAQDAGEKLATDFINSLIKGAETRELRLSAFSGFDSNAPIGVTQALSQTANKKWRSEQNIKRGTALEGEAIDQAEYDRLGRVTEFEFKRREAAVARAPGDRVISGASGLDGATSVSMIFASGRAAADSRKVEQEEALSKAIEGIRADDSVLGYQEGPSHDQLVDARIERIESTTTDMIISGHREAQLQASRGGERNRANFASNYSHGQSGLPMEFRQIVGEENAEGRHMTESGNLATLLASGSLSHGDYIDIYAKLGQSKDKELKNIDRLPTKEWISDASDLTSAFQSSFSSIGNAASAMGIKTGNVFKKMDSTLSGSMQIMAGITTAMDATNPLAMPMGIMQGIGGVANIVGGLFSKDDKEEAKEARRARTFGTTINRGPTQYTIAPSLVIENGGDVYMGSEGIDAAAKTISNIVTEGLEYNGGPALQ